MRYSSDSGYYEQYGLTDVIQNEDWSRAIEIANEQLRLSRESYHSFAEPGDGVVASISAGVGEIFRLERIIKDLEEEHNEALIRANERASVFYCDAD